MSIDWLSFVVGASPLVVAIILKTLLDIHVWPRLIKCLNWVPCRSVYRDDPPKLRGEWDVYWETESDNFKDPLERKKSAIIYQFGSFCYADYSILGERYAMTGRIESGYLTGIWYNLRDRNGYRGAFQLRIVDGKRLEGRWLGFSKSTVDIKSGLYRWTKNVE